MTASKIPYAQQLTMLESAWSLMGAGYSMTEAASLIGVPPEVLDRGIWRWRALTTNSKQQKGAA